MGRRDRHQREIVSLLLKIVSVLESKRPYAVGHSRRVAEMARRIAERMGLPPSECSTIYLAGLLHDIGYLSMPDEIFQSNEPLAPQQREMADSQLQVGLQILNTSLVMRPVCDLLRFLRHRYQAKDSEQDCQGERIPLGSRILQVAEVFDALTSHRPHRRRYSISEALREMENDEGRFDPKVMKVFRDTMQLEVSLKGRSKKELDDFQDNLERICRGVMQGKLGVPTVAKAGPVIERMLRNEQASMKQISEVIELEPSLALKIMGTANSALFYGMPQVNSVSEALVRLGINETRDLLLAYMFRNLFKARQMIFRNAAENWWEHSLLTAAACQSLAPSCGNITGDYAYLLGLLHDVGKPCLLQALLEQLDQRQFREQCVDLIFAAISRHHARVGMLVLKKANFPSSFVAALGFKRNRELVKRNREALLLTLAQEIVRQVRSESELAEVNLDELLAECQVELTPNDIRRAVGATIHRYQTLQGMLASQENGRSQL